MKKIVMMIMVSLFLMGMTSMAKAVILIPGQNNTSTTGATPDYGDNVVLAQVISPYSFGYLGNMTGTVTTSVYRNSTGLLFTYLVQRSADGIDENVTRLTAASYYGFNTNADYDLATAGTSIAGEVDRHSPAVVGFDFQPVIDEGGTTKVLYGHLEQYLSLTDGHRTWPVSLRQYQNRQQYHF
jgi:hypothetical protein